jgi:hypothetical protein
MGLPVMVSHTVKYRRKQNQPNDPKTPIAQRLVLKKEMGMD